MAWPSTSSSSSVRVGRAMEGVLCKFYAQGACAKGRACRFSHDRSTARADNVCRFYLQGKCAYGDRCRYDHVKPKARATGGGGSSLGLARLQKRPAKAAAATTKPRAAAAPPAAAAAAASAAAAPFVPAGAAAAAGRTAGKRLGAQHSRGEEANMLCPFGLAGECPYEDCGYLHGEQCPCCLKHCLDPRKPETHQEHLDMCVARVEEELEQQQRVERGVGVTCSICLEEVMKKTPLGDRRFGLLSSCAHPFCLKCIRSWRGQSGQGKQVRTCPICRVSSFFVVPSSYWISDPGEKDAVIQKYMSELAAKDCKHFDQGRGTCPFGSSCFYRHVYPDGREEEVMGRFRGGRDGNYERMHDVYLNEFFDERDRYSFSDSDSDY